MTVSPVPYPHGVAVGPTDNDGAVALLVTYSTMTDSALSGAFVTKSIGPLDAVVGVPGKRKIMVYFGKAAMWSIPLEECQTWFVGFLVRAGGRMG